MEKPIDTNETNPNIFTRHANAGESFRAYYDQLLRETKPITYPLFELPCQKNDQFTGREEQLDQIDKYLNQQNTLAITNTASALAQAISGLGGVGKTQLVIEYAYRRKDKYKVIWFLNGQNMDSDYLRLAAQLKVYGEKRDDIILRTKLKLQELRNYLLIIDDAENYEAIKGYLPQTRENGHILVTSRHRDWEKPLELDMFELQEGLDYFDKLTDFDVEVLEDVIYLIDKLLGLLPLALTQAGAFIKQTGISVKEYINFFENKLKELWGVEDKARDYSQAITVTWEITINRIKEKYPQAEKLLAGMSCLAAIPNKIDQSWLSGLVEDEQIRLNSLGELAAYSMIAKYQELGGFLVHSLVQEVVFSRIDDIEKLVYLQLIFEQLKINYPHGNYECKEDFLKQKILLPHLENFMKKIETLKKNEDVNQELREQLLTLLADEYDSLGDFHKSKNYLENAIKIFEIYKGNEHEKLRIMLSDLGRLYRELGESKKANEALNRALAIDIKNSVNNKEIAVIYENLGNVSRDLADFKQAEVFLRGALEIFEKDKGINNVDVARVLGNLAYIYLELDKISLARDLLERAIKIFEKYYGPEHIETAKMLAALARAYRYLNNVSKEKELLECAFKIEKSYYGEHEHLEMAKTLGSLGNAYGKLGKIEIQIKFLEHAQRIFEKYDDERNLALTLGNLAIAYGNLGNFKLEETLLNNALRIQNKYYLSNHPELGVTTFNLAAVNYKQSRFIEALKFLKTAHRIFLSNYGDLHLRTQQSKNLLNMLEFNLAFEKGEKSNQASSSITFFQTLPSVDEWLDEIQPNRKKIEEKKETLEVKPSDIDVWTDYYSDEEEIEYDMLESSSLTSDDEEYKGSESSIKSGLYM